MRALLVLAVVFGLLFYLGGPSAVLSRVFTGDASGAQGALPPETVTAAPPQAGPNEILFTEADVNDRLTAALAGNTALPVRNLAVRLLGDNVASLTGYVTILGIEAPLSATLAFRSTAGTVDVEVTGAQAGPLPLPTSFISGITQQMMRTAGLSGVTGNQLPDGIDRLEVRPGALVIVKR